MSSTLFVGSDLGAPAAGTTLENMAVVKQAIQHGADRRGIAQQLAPILDGTIRGHQSAGPLIASQHDLQQIFGRGRGSLRIPKSSMMSKGTLAKAAM